MKQNLDKKFDEYSYLKNSNLKDIRSSKFTYFLMLILIFMFFAQFFIIGLDNLRFFMLNSADLFNGVYHSVFTALFFHVDIFHLLFNLIALFIFGRHVEKHFGWKVIPLFVICGIIANVISSVIAYNLGDIYNSIGASSGIAGFIVLALLLEPISIATFFGWAFIFLDIIGLSNTNSTTNHLAHIGGYVSLFILLFFIEYEKRRKIYAGFFINIIFLVILYFILEYFNLGLFLLN